MYTINPLTTSSTTACPSFFSLRVALPSPRLTISSSFPVSPSITGTAMAPLDAPRGAIDSVQWNIDEHTYTSWSISMATGILPTLAYITVDIRSNTQGFWIRTCLDLCGARNNFFDMFITIMLPS